MQPPILGRLSTGDFTMFARFKTTGLGSGQLRGGIMSLGYGVLLQFGGGKNLNITLHKNETKRSCNNSKV